MRFDVMRALRHAWFDEWVVRKAFPESTLDAIEHAIAASESLHRAEIRFVVEGGLPWSAALAGQSARERATELFSVLRIWDTEDNSGVLIYVLLAERRIEILTDRGIVKAIPNETFEDICAQMSSAFKLGRYREACVEAIHRVCERVIDTMPLDRPNPNELPNRPVVL